jgi:DNA-binding transcriptional regulator GbsR (MarR family)
MNYMKKQELLQLQKLSNGIGEFIRYWGFRNIHGQIWSVVYLSAKPLSGIEICELLVVSKALVSPALKELEAEGLIRQTISENSKTKRYVAESNVTKIIHGVLKRREMPMIEKIRDHHASLSSLGAKSDDLNMSRLESMGLMIEMAQMGLDTLLQSDQALGD